MSEFLIMPPCYILQQIWLETDAVNVDAVYSGGTFERYESFYLVRSGGRRPVRFTASMLVAIINERDSHVFTQFIFTPN